MTHKVGSSDFLHEVHGVYYHITRPHFSALRENVDQTLEGWIQSRAVSKVVCPDYLDTTLCGHTIADMSRNGKSRPHLSGAPDPRRQPGALSARWRRRLHQSWINQSSTR